MWAWTAMFIVVELLCRAHSGEARPGGVDLCVCVCGHRERMRLSFGNVWITQKGAGC